LPYSKNNVNFILEQLMAVGGEIKAFEKQPYELFK
jgi:hypothetical protein